MNDVVVDALYHFRDFHFELDFVQFVKVEIHLDNGQMIVINNPVISKVDVAGQTTFQVVGSDIIEQSIESEEKEVEILEEDITLVSQQTGVDIDTAKNALEMTSGDLAQAIMLLKNR